MSTEPIIGSIGTDKPKSEQPTSSTPSSTTATTTPPSPSSKPPSRRRSHGESHMTRHHKPRHQPPPDSGFVLTERIGKGSFAVVYKGEWGGDLLPPPQDGRARPPRQEVAIKVVLRSHLKREKRLMDIFEAEMAILKRMVHPHIVHLIDVVQTSSDFNLIMEYCSFGDLSSLIRRRQQLAKRHPEIADVLTRYPPTNNGDGGLHPALVRHFLAQLACSLAFLREHDIVHRDLKPQNLLLTAGATSAEQAAELNYAGSWSLPVVKIADFGFARFLPSTSLAETLCGSPLYMAPEILNYEKYNAKADLWSVGAVTYEMVVGKPPFPAVNHMELIKKIDAGKDVIDFPFDVAPDLQEIIRGLLKRSPDERLTFEEFFQRTAWSETENDLPNRPSESSEVAASTNSVVAESGNATKLSPVSSRDSKSDSSTSLRGSGYSAFLRRQGVNAVAVESASPSPENSIKQPTGSGSKGKPKSDGSDCEYVFVEKRTVEVNSLADDLQEPKPVRRLTNPERKPRRRLSSITYGASPTSALAQALLKSSARLFGAKVSSSGSGSSGSGGGATTVDLNSVDSLSIPPPLNVALANPKTGEKQIIDELEQLATIAKVVILYAGVKFTQLDLDEEEQPTKNLNASFSSSSSRIGAAGLCPMPSPSSHIDPYFQLSLAQESLALHLKALGVLARAMDRASEWWSEQQQQQQQQQQQSNGGSPAINTLVQWIRDKFNECLEHAEAERTIIHKLTKELSTDDGNVHHHHSSEASAEKLLFDRALEMAKAAAVQEMAALSTSNSSQDDALTTCEMNYGTAVWMLKALLVCDKPEDALGDDDRMMVDTLMGKIAQRLSGLRRKAAASAASAASNSRWSPNAAGSPNSQSSFRSLRMGSRASVSSQLTPP